MQPIPWRQSKELIKSDLLKDRVDLVSHQEKEESVITEAVITIGVTFFFAGFKRESTQDQKTQTNIT